MKNWNLRDLFGTHRSAFSMPGEARGEIARLDETRVGLDALSPAELRSLASAHARFASQSSGSDLLRLPRVSNITEQEINAAVVRVAASAVVSKSEAAMTREQTMRRVLAEIAEMMTAAHRKPNSPA